MIKSKNPSQHTTPHIRRHKREPPLSPDEVAPTATVMLASCGGAGVRGRNGGGRRPRWREKEETSCRGERHLRWLITDALVAGRWSWQRLVVLVAQGGAGGRNGDGVGFLWRRKKEEEAEEENLQRGEGGRLVFLAYFGPDFLLSQAIKSASIYRQWKR